jgi:hypothetical protein
MKKITEEQFFARYPKYSNFNELKKADILVMPSGDNNDFAGSQAIFRNMSSDCGINCLYYSEEQPCYWIRELSAPSLETAIYFGVVAIQSAAAAIKIYQFFKERLQGKFRNSPLRIIAHKLHINYRFPTQGWWDLKFPRHNPGDHFFPKNCILLLPSTPAFIYFKL